VIPKRHVSRLLRVLGSAVAILAVFWFLPVEEVWTAARNVPPVIWIASFICFLLGHVLASWKWWIVAGFVSGVPVHYAVRGHFYGLAANLCLPGVVGGDVIRAGYLMRNTSLVPRVAAGSVADRLIDCFSLFVLAVGGAALSVRSTLRIDGVLLAVGTALALALVTFFAIPNAVVRWRPPRAVERVAMAIVELRRSPVRLVVCFGLSLLVQSLFVLLSAWLGWACGVDADLSAWFAAWPLAKLVAVVPISVAGLGVREATLGTVLAQFGADPARAVAAGFVWQSVLFAGALAALAAVLVSAKCSGVRQAISREAA
jgi:uncharacterized membrane protein YbhN (UPF0104 family)